MPVLDPELAWGSVSVPGILFYPCPTGDLCALSAVHARLTRPRPMPLVNLGASASWPSTSTHGGYACMDRTPVWSFGRKKYDRWGCFRTARAERQLFRCLSQEHP